MQNDLQGFNANDHQPMGEFTPLPAGDYRAMATSAEWRDTKKGDGERLVFTWSVLEGEQKGRTMITGHNLRNPNDTAVRIANSELSSICHAVGIPNPHSSSQLLNIPVMLTVVVEERNDKPGVMKNEITGYEAPGGKTSNNQEPPPHTDADATGPAPWRKK